MNLIELRSKAAELFPQSVRFGISKPGNENPSLEELRALCAENHKQLGFDSQNDCFSAVVPKLKGNLSLDAWCTVDMEIAGWPLRIEMKPLYLGAGYVHFEIRHDGPMGKFSETGYRSHFTPLSTFTEFSPEEYLTLIIGTRPREEQLSLF